MNFQRFLFLSLILCFGIVSKAQTKSNLELVDSLISASVNELENSINKNEKVFLEVVSPLSFEVLKGKIYNSFSKKFHLLNTKQDSIQFVNFYLLKVKTSYGEPRKESIFGNFLVERKIEIYSNVVVKNSSNQIKTLEINKSSVDTVYLDEINMLEDKSLPFTQSEIPNIPLLSNLLEPIIVIGTLIVSTVLLFVVRSK
ncbi:hypothetical protein [Stygiobacter electus]|uniref:Uncharacterized protein n=1 Tax=Stygiobacter electus TaxID=3032292 RepID=A0AAE3P1Y7_9BACT|nr:hypothetical protein [Stygiobacter electus]MDF1611335.1 hypothetical protein [Stygiobacter electus]